MLNNLARPLKDVIQLKWPSEAESSPWLQVTSSLRFTLCTMFFNLLHNLTLTSILLQVQLLWSVCLGWSQYKYSSMLHCSRKHRLAPSNIYKYQRVDTGECKSASYHWRLYRIPLWVLIEVENCYFHSCVNMSYLNMGVFTTCEVNKAVLIKNTQKSNKYVSPTVFQPSHRVTMVLIDPVVKH